jgi:hypothetical protein
LCSWGAAHVYESDEVLVVASLQVYMKMKAEKYVAVIGRTWKVGCVCGPKSAFVFLLCAACELHRDNSSGRLHAGPRLGCTAYTCCDNDHKNVLLDVSNA